MDPRSYQQAMKLCYSFQRKNRIKRTRARRRLRERSEGILQQAVTILQRRLIAHTVLMSLIFMSVNWQEDRAYWARCRPGAWFQYAYDTFDDTDWLENFRMKRETFEFVVRQLRSEISKKTTNWRKPIPVVKRVAITLWRLSTNCEYRTIGHLFGVARNTACNIVNSTCRVIREILTPRFVTIPRGRRLEEVINGFEDRGFPQCVGAIDGTHIPIIAPEKDPADFYNRKGWHSINVQAVCDHECRFTNLFIGFPGKAHDAKVLAHSKLYEYANNGQIFPDRPRVIEGVEVPLFVVGDPAYPLLPWLMKAYPGRRLSANCTIYNDRLADVRKIIEMAFGRCKARWRCLLKRNDSNIGNLIDIVYACFTLNNICEIFREGFDEEWLLDQDLDERVHRLLQPHRARDERPAGIRNTARRIREGLKDFVNL